MAANGEPPALRVSQLDASELDTEIFDLLNNQLNSAFKYFKPGLLVRYSAEVSAILKLVIWKFTINSSASTVGQRLLEIHYRNAEQPQSAKTLLTSHQKALYAALTIILPWLHERSPDLAVYTKNFKYADKFWQGVEWLEKSWKVVALVNFLVFLHRGQHQFLTERLLGIRAVFSRPQELRQVGFEYMDRELLWHGFAEFLFFMLPLINFRRIKNYVSRKLVTSSTPGGTESVRSVADMEECAVCGEWPYNPHQIGCRHVFCYYCIQSNVEADASYPCPLCGCGVTQPDDVKPVLSTTGKLLS